LTGEDSPLGTPQQEADAPTGDAATDCSIGLNPLTWFRAIPCILKALFIPSGDVLSGHTSQLVEEAKGKPPMNLVTPLVPVVQGMGSGWGSSCAGLPDFDPFGDRLSLPCEGPPDSAALQALRTLATVGIIGMTVFRVWHMVMAGLGGNSTGEE
jgi:hypothetical protein